MVCVMRKVTNSKSLELKGIYVHAYIVYTLQTIVCIKIRNH